MNTKLELHKEYKNTKLQILAFSSLLSILSIFGCGKNSNVHGDTDLEYLNKIEENLGKSNGFLPTDERKKSINDFEDGSKNLSAKGIKENPHVIFDILKEKNIEQLETLLLKGSNLKDGLTGTTQIGGATLMDIIIEHVLGEDKNNTNPTTNSGPRSNARKLFDIILKTVPNDSEFICKYAEDCAKGNWLYATDAVIKRIFETKNQNWKETINLIPTILQTQKNIFFKGGDKEERWDETLNLITEKNKTIISNNTTIHRAFLEGITDKWPKFTSDLAKKLSTTDQNLPKNLEKDYQKTLLEEIINNGKFEKYKVQKNYIINKLGAKACTPSIIAAAIDIKEPETQILKQLFSIPDADLSTIVAKNSAYGDSENIISYYVKSLKDIKLKDFLNHLESNIKAKNPEFNFRDEVNKAYNQILPLSSTGILGTDYTEALRILKEKAEKQ